jgi:hypothetical protein
MKRLRLLAVVGALTALAVPAIAAGLWWGFPVIGGATYCTSYSLYPTTATVPGTLPTANQCNIFAPAGPTATTGAEMIPVDTGVTQGTTSAYLPVPSAASGAYQYIDGRTVLIAGPYTVSNNITNVLVESTTTIATLTLTMPAAPYNGQIVRVGSVNTVTAFWPLANTGQTLKGPVPTVITASTTAPEGYAWVYNGPVAAWYRVQ